MTCNVQLARNEELCRVSSIIKRVVAAPSGGIALGLSTNANSTSYHSPVFGLVTFIGTVPIGMMDVVSYSRKTIAVS